MGSKDQEDQAALSRLKHKTLFDCQRAAPYSGVTTAKRFSSTCPIVDPTLWEMRRAALITDLLLAKDEYCMKFISVFREKFPKE